MIAGAFGITALKQRFGHADVQAATPAGADAGAQHAPPADEPGAATGAPPITLRPGWGRPLPHELPRPTYWPMTVSAGIVFGSATLAVFLVQVVTGVALTSSYVPSSGQAYDSLAYITNNAPLGNMLRGMHYFGASAMVVLIGIHIIRLYRMAAYKFPREVNWLSGVALLVFTLAMAFTGQLLRWDQNAIWSVVVEAEQAGRAPLIGNWLAQLLLAGQTIGAATLSRFFALHVFIFPALIFGTISFHLYLVIRNGISEPPKSGQMVDPKTYRAWYNDLLHREGEPFWPDAVWRDAIFSVVVIGVVVALAIIFGPPAIDKPPDPTIIQAHPKPDWYLWCSQPLASAAGRYTRARCCFIPKAANTAT